jgi:hypothetical protein
MGLEICLPYGPVTRNEPCISLLEMNWPLNGFIGVLDAKQTSEFRLNVFDQGAFEFGEDAGLKSTQDGR